MMPSNVETRVRVLYEIAMAIGNTLDEKQLLQDCLKVILRKLNGVAISYYDTRQDCVMLALPRRGMKQDYIERLEVLLAAEKQRYSESGFVRSWQLDSGLIQYAFKISHLGWLTLVSAQSIDELTLSSLGPVCDKLATSIQSCRGNQQLIEQEQRLQTALYNLKKAQQSRDSFLANMSHEIRTPLNGILGFLYQLEDTDLTSQQQHYLSIIKHSSDTLVAIINDILDFSKMDAGKLTLDVKPFHLIDAVTPIVELFRAKAAKQNTFLEFIQQGNIPEVIRGDSLRLKQILSNLISNAVKFSENKQVSVILQAQPGEQLGRVLLSLQVRDTGIGIAPEKLALLGQPFVQAESTTTHHFGGTGLGLAICKGLLDLMGSKLQIESVLGQGSCFYFSWQAEVCQSKTAVNEPRALKQNLGQAYPEKRVLLVEDNKVNQMLMKAILSKVQLKPDLAEDGQQAVDMYCAASGVYDLVLMDINMPVMDGVEATQKIRQYESEAGLEATPIIALTANVLRGDRERYLAHSMNEVLAKPLEMDKLNQVFTQFLNQ
ncbi:response regulator [Thiomicrospira microaerophila]|uniref:ATP-binding protein n=1 Tax=Thiomicrospira microaerophila TaxID=406020 RepID=UPI00200D5029|nr:ATP-binding protein [Thiomicrospira microaerophila]UQB41414.1 response regulator [Thiomicrospira microaerophila]